MNIRTEDFHRYQKMLEDELVSKGFERRESTQDFLLQAFNIGVRIPRYESTGTIVYSYEMINWIDGPQRKEEKPFNFTDSTKTLAKVKQEIENRLEKLTDGPTKK